MSEIAISKTNPLLFAISVFLSNPRKKAKMKHQWDEGEKKRKKSKQAKIHVYLEELLVLVSFPLPPIP